MYRDRKMRRQIHQCIFMAVIIIFLITILMFGYICANGNIPDRTKQQRFEVSDSFGVEEKNFRDVFGEN